MNTDYSDLNELDRQRIETLVEQGTSHDDAVTQVRAEKANNANNTAQTPVGGGAAGTTEPPAMSTDFPDTPFGRGDTITTAPALLEDPRDARIAELEAEVESLKAASPGAATPAKPLSVAERTAELAGQGLTEEDAAEQAAYEARTTADNSPPPVQTTV